MGGGYPSTAPALGYRLDRQGCLYGQETRERAPCMKDGESCLAKADSEGCLYGQETRRTADRVSRTLTKVFWLAVTTTVGVWANLFVMLARQ